MIDVETTLEGHKIFLTFVYGDPVVEHRGRVWERLTRLSLTRNGAWLMIGDFNEIKGNQEKRGGKRRPESSFIPFRTMLENCGMIDFPYKGNSLSWVGRRSTGKVKCRLDRAVGNEDWHSLFSHTNVEYLQLWGSDHRPILANIKPTPRRPRRNFHFDKRWLDKPGFKETVIAGWNEEENRHEQTIHQKITTCRRSISRWKTNLPTNTARRIEELKTMLDNAQTDDATSLGEVLDLRRQLCEAYREEELFWKQKSRSLWLKEGDKNTRFFHATTKQRRARNRIISLKDPNDNWVETTEGLEKVAIHYFQNLFTSSSSVDMDVALRCITEKISDTTNQTLIAVPSEEEIRAVCFEINPDKAPGPDGMTSRFYQHFWSDIKPDIVNLVRNFFEMESFDTRLNQTNICLIPKKDRPRDMSEFRPISLCNVSYKIISKLLCKRLKLALPSIVSETQSAFMTGRLITDNILLAQENFHALRTNPMCRSKFMAIKTDMSKAYDRVEWSFLEVLLLKLGFAEKWVRLLMFCISSVTYHVIINGEAKGKIKPSRGIHY